MADTGYIAHLTGYIREIVVDCYLLGLKHTYCKSQAHLIEIDPNFW